MTEEEWDRKYNETDNGRLRLTPEEKARQDRRAAHATTTLENLIDFSSVDVEDPHAGRTDQILMIIANHLGDLNETLKEISAKLK